jgi:hypothetical protein
VTVWVVIPAHGRIPVSRVAFAGIAWTLKVLRHRGIDVRALVIADDANIQVAQEHGFDTLVRPNRPLGRKWNDGYEHACRNGATHVMSCGSDDWIHPDLVLAMLRVQAGNAIVATRRSAAVAPDGREIALLTIPYEGGDGIRLLPLSLLKTVGCRPTSDSRDRAIDGAMRDQLTRNAPIRWEYVETHPLHIVDFKTVDNLTPFEKFAAAGYVTGICAFDTLSEHYPANLVAPARELYAPSGRA